MLHNTNHGSDHEAIETTFDVAVPEQVSEERLLFKNALWNKIRDMISARLVTSSTEGDIQKQTDLLTLVVSEAVHTLTPKAKPSPYAKKWWTSDLTWLRKEYTQLRNHAMKIRRIGTRDRKLEVLIKEASKQYHNAIQKQKKDHWDNFLADDANIWQAMKYLSSNQGSSFDKVSLLKRADNITTRDRLEQIEKLLTTFFSPLSAAIEEEGDRPQRLPVEMPKLTEEEVKH